MDSDYKVDDAHPAEEVEADVAVIVDSSSEEDLKKPTTTKVDDDDDEDEFDLVRHPFKMNQWSLWPVLSELISC
jgi:hypothetical protein